MDTTLENRAETTTEFERNKRRMKEVNSLLRKAFGRSIPFIYDVRGNANHGVVMAEEIHLLDHLEVILTTNFLGGQHVGEFTKRDGSSMRLSGDRYLNEARRYAELYKAKYGKNVQIEVA